MDLKKKKLSRFICTLSLAGISAPLFADPCSTSVNNGGIETISHVESVGIFSGTDNWVDSNWRDIAEDVQEKYGNSVAHDGLMGEFTFVLVTKVYNIGPPFVQTHRVPYSGTTSLEKAILDWVNVDSGKPDPSPCDGPGPQTPQDSPAEDTSTTSSGNAGSSGTGSSYGGGSGSGTYVQSGYTTVAVPVTGYASCNGCQTSATSGYQYISVPNYVYNGGA